MYYKKSKDYEWLWNLLDGSRNFEFICYVDYHYTHKSSNPERDIAIITFTDRVKMIARGIEYSRPGITTKEELIADCKRMNLEWVTPEGDKLNQDS